MPRAQSTETVLVTGAGGTIGYHVVSLAEAAGYRVIATDMTGVGVPTPVRGQTRYGDLTDSVFLKSVVAGCDVIIHTAGTLDVGAPAAHHSRVNSEVLINLYEAARAQGVKRFIHASTAMVYAPRQTGWLTEEAQVTPRGVHGLSKHSAELYLLSQMAARDPAWTILRFAPIYGKRGRHFAASLLVFGPVLRAISPVVPKFEGGPEGTMLHAEDAASAMVFALRKPEMAFRVFNVSDGDAMTLAERINATIEAYGIGTRGVVKLEEPWLTKIGGVFDRPMVFQGADVAMLALWRYVRARYGLKPALRPRLDTEAVSLLWESLKVDAGALRALGWSPRFASFREGWRGALSWYQAEGWVPRFADRR